MQILIFGFLQFITMLNVLKTIFLNKIFIEIYAVPRNYKNYYFK